MDFDSKSRTWCGFQCNSSSRLPFFFSFSINMRPCGQKCSKPAIVGVLANNIFTLAHWRDANVSQEKQIILYVSNTSARRSVAPAQNNFFKESIPNRKHLSMTKSYLSE